MPRVPENACSLERLRDQFQSGENSEEYDFVFDEIKRK